MAKSGLYGTLVFHFYKLSVTKNVPISHIKDRSGKSQ